MPHSTAHPGAQDDPPPAASPASDDWPELLTPAVWQPGLDKFARATHLAVALADADGGLIGECLNPQPLWRLLRGKRPPFPGACPFHLSPANACTCIPQAVGAGQMVLVRDRIGLVHFAVPLAVAGRGVGALVAGQVFDGYPEQLALEQTAKTFGVPAEKVSQQARLQRPVSRTTLQVYADLLATFGASLLETRHHNLQEKSRLAEVERGHELLRRANDELERRVRERTGALEEAQRKGLQAERLAAIGQMVAGLAHESRNALQRSQACLSLLGFRLEGQAEAIDLLNRVQKAQDDLHRLFNEVREYAVPLQLELRTCNLADVWREAWADLLPLRFARNGELREEIDGVDLRCVASPFHLRQVFRNLMDNALNVGKEAASVTIRCSPAEIAGAAAVGVSLRDDGPGFTAEQRQRAFEPFFTTKVRGTGLGLAICKRIVEAHGGRIELGGDDGPGAEILLTLPRRIP